MRFSEIIGNEDVKRSLVNMADGGRVAHAMLFYENEGCGALALALAYAQYLNCPNRHDGDSCGECPSCRRNAKLLHPDLHFVFPTNAGSKCSLPAKDITSDIYLKDWNSLALRNPYFMESELLEELGIESKSWDINVAEAKSIISKLSLAPVGNGYKIAVVYLPEKMNVTAANKLLKIVEEPPRDTVFLFITHNPDKVLQTIFSRCQSSRVVPLTKEEVGRALEETFGVAPQEAEEEAALSGGSIGAALHALRDREDRAMFMGLSSELMHRLLAKDLTGALEIGEQLADMGSREKQKAYLVFLSDCLRKIFMLQQKMDAIACIPSGEAAFYREMASKCSKKFVSRTLPALDGALYMIERNVNQKILFCDLVNRMSVNII